MLSWAVRILLVAGGVIATWFVSRDSPGFGIMQAMFATLLLVLVVAVLAFWPARWARKLNRRRKAKPEKPDAPKP